MEYTAGQEAAKGESYDCSKDFKVLTPAEKRYVLKTAKNLLKLQRENALKTQGCQPLFSDSDTVEIELLD
jgi:hypothetical protein